MGTFSGERSPGVAKYGSTLLDIKTGQWLHDSGSSMVPGQVARRMNGAEFKNFDQFRSRFWKEVAGDPTLSKSFRPSNLERMRGGKAPFARTVDQRGQRAAYELDHYKEIRDGGGVYDLNKIRIKTPVSHINMLGLTFNNASTDSG